MTENNNLSLFFYLCLAIVTVLMQLSCSTTPHNYEGPDRGFLVFSLALDDMITDDASSIAVRLRNEDNTIREFGQFTRKGLFKEKASDGIGGKLFVFSLPAGDYEFYNFNIFFNTYGKYSYTLGNLPAYTSHAHNHVQTSISFVINENEVTYAGMFEPTQRGRSEIKIATTNFATRDLPIAYKKDPRIKGQKMHSQIYGKKRHLDIDLEPTMVPKSDDPNRDTSRDFKSFFAPN